MNNPFKPASPVAAKMKVLLYGASGVGKTLAALSFPRVAVIDTERGTDLYAGRPGVAPFSVLSAKTIPAVQQALDFIRADNGNTFDTVVLDGITKLYDVQKDAARNANKNGDIDARAWGRIGDRMKMLHDTLTTMPTHVVVTAREAVEYDPNSGADLKRIGFKADAHKSLEYEFDFVIRMLPDHCGIVTKSRGSLLGERDKLARIDWSVFAALATQYADGVKLERQSDADAAQAESVVYSWNEETVNAWRSRWHAKGVTDADLRAALGDIGRWSEWTGGEQQADFKVDQFIKAQLAQKPATPISNGNGHSVGK